MPQKTLADTLATWNHPEGEPDLGWTGHGRGCTADEPRDDREGDDEREQPMAEW